MEESRLRQDPFSLTVAQELLNRPNHTRQRSTFTTASIKSQQLDRIDWQGAEPSADAPHEGRTRLAAHTSNTWTTSSGDVISDQDGIDDRTLFVQEYNRLARKHGVRDIVPEEHQPAVKKPFTLKSPVPNDMLKDDSLDSFSKQSSWFSRMILRRTSSSQSVKAKSDRHLKRMRSISDSLRSKKRDRLKDKDLQDLARLCGLSLLYLPTEYAAGSLAVPTCFRATAQYLVQHAPSARGVFRIPGSQNAVSALYNHYCSMDEEGQAISGTVTCPTLPDHISCDTHDVASAFKKFLSGLPGGILGSLALFSAFISIHTQFQGDAELTRTKQSKVRARLIALAVATLRSQYRRELICAVFGLLSMIGRAAETAPREDERGRPLPTSDLMGYGPLGIVFGPLLVGDLLEDYTIRLVNPNGGLVLLPISPPKSRKERSKKNKSGEEGTSFSNHVDKIKVANSITEMLITHWRDVVRQMKNVGALKAVVGPQSLAVRTSNPPSLRPSASETFALRKPPDWDTFGSPRRRAERSVSPTPNRHSSRTLDDLSDYDAPLQQIEMLKIQKQRARQKAPLQYIVSRRRSRTILSPTKEESLRSDSHRGLQISESKPRSTTRSPSGSNVLNSTTYGRKHRDLKEEANMSNESSDKENKPPSEEYQSILDTRGQRSGNHQPHQMEHGKNRESDGFNCTSDIFNNKRCPDVKTKIYISTSVPDTTLKHEGDSSAASASATPKPQFTPSRKRYSPASTRWDSTRASEGQPADLKPDSHRGVNKLTKSAERAQGRGNRVKAGLIKGKHIRIDTPGKRVEKKIDSSKQSSTPGTEVKHSVMQVNMHDKFWPFDQMPGIDSSSAQNANLEITISRSSSRNLSDTVPKLSRRVGGSEPSLQPRYLAAPSSRKVSRSLDDNLRQRSKNLELQRYYFRSKDPLSRVSYQEDMASLAELAQALDSEEAARASPSPKPDYSQKSVAPDHLESKSSRALPSPMDACQPACMTSGEHDSVQDKQHAQPNQPTTGSISPTKNSGQRGSRRPQEDAACVRSLDNQDIQLRPRKRTGSPRSPSSKISALVAKYNNANSAPILPPGNPSPPKPPFKTVPRDPSGKLEEFREGLVAPYTINPPTPTRSRMSARSGKSDRTTQSRRTPESNIRQATPERHTSPSKIPTPSKVLRSSLHDKTPLESVQKIEQSTHKPSTDSSSNIPNARFEAFGSPPSNYDGPTSKVARRTSSQGVSYGSADGTALVVQRLARSTIRTTPPPSVRRSVDEVVTEIRGSRPSLLHPATLRSVKETLGSSTEVSGGQRSSSGDAQSPPHKPENDVTLDGSAGEMRTHSYHQRASVKLPPVCVSPPVSVNDRELVHPDSPFQETFSRQGSPSLSPPDDRSNSVLSREITSLQKQLVMEREAGLQLRQQLDACKNEDQGNLAELKEARIELDKWKTRAKVAEKQLEIALRNPSRSVSDHIAYSPSMGFSGRTNTSGSDYPHRIQSLQDIRSRTDGAGSSEESQSSCETVIRELHSLPRAREYSIWVAQKMTVGEGPEVPSCTDSDG